MNIDFEETLFDPEKEKDNQKLFSDQAEEETASGLFKKELSSNQLESWKVLVVDDEEDVHSITRMALKGFTYKEKEIQFLHTYSAEEARLVLKNNPDIALIFLDVVMESNEAGLELVKYIRNELNNHLTQIVLRTGYPGQAPEREVIVEYEINDYKTKTELTSFKLFTVTLASLRAYDSMSHLDSIRQNLEIRVKERTLELERKSFQIMEMDQMKTRFFHNLSHEFRTPLSLIMSPLEEMLIKEDLDEKERSTIEMMYRNSIRLLGLINQLLDLSKIDAGKLKIELIEYDINKVLRMIARGFSPMAERKNIRYKVDISDEKYITYFDRDKLEKILTNLLSNAFKFTPVKGQVLLKISHGNKTETSSREILHIDVQDSGYGIPSEQIDKIFDRFYQVANSRENGSGGTGIGLSLTNELIKLQHGIIKVKSKPNEGSRFTVILPIGKDHLDEREYVLKTHEEINEDSFIQKCRIHESDSLIDITYDSISDETDKSLVLIIEDNADVRQHICDNFKETFKVKQASNGKEGFEKAMAIIPDLIISDIKMPGMDGLELCDKLKTEECTCHIPIILLTAQADSEHKIKGLLSGADDYLLKPFNMNELLARSNNLIDQRKKLRESYKSQIETEPGKVAVTSADERFLKLALEVIEKNIGDCNFDVNSFYPEMNMSRMQLFRKLKALVNQTPGELIRNMRLQRAAQLLKQNFGNIAEITYEVGFNNLSYFAKCFREKYGVLPSEFKSSR